MLRLDVEVAEIDPKDTAALHSWYYALLELVKRTKESKKRVLVEQAESISREQERRRARAARSDDALRRAAPLPPQLASIL
jgi:hypothetical protein